MRGESKKKTVCNPTETMELSMQEEMRYNKEERRKIFLDIYASFEVIISFIF
jgi:hypothetical protein